MFGEEEEERKEGRESTSPSPSASSSEHSDLSDDDVPGAMEPERAADQSAPVKKSVSTIKYALLYAVSRCLVNSQRK